MKTRNFSLLLSLLFLTCCSANQSQTDEKKHHEPIQISKENSIKKSNAVFQKVHSLKKKDGTFIGDVYVNFINDKVFASLYVIDKADTIYSIEKNVLSNARGKDTEVFGDGFWGYKFVLKKNDYIVLSYFRNKGKYVSDDITIMWNYDDNIMEVQKVP